MKLAEALSLHIAAQHRAQVTGHSTQHITTCRSGTMRVGMGHTPRSRPSPGSRGTLSSRRAGAATIAERPTSRSWHIVPANRIRRAVASVFGEGCWDHGSTRRLRAR